MERVTRLTVRQLRGTLGRNETPNESTVRRLMKMFFETGSTVDLTNPARETIVLLRDRFQDRVISRNSDHQWAQRSCDLTTCDFHLWGHLKSLV